MIRQDIKRWPHQSYGVHETIRRIQAGVRRSCLTSPTGGGKSVMMMDLIDFAVSCHWGATLYTNRKLLMEQIGKDLQKANIDYGIRAADYVPDFAKPVQLASIQTEYSRSVKKETWNVSQSKLVLIDEAHLQKGDMANELVKRHLANGASVVLITATPLDMGDMADELIVAGTTSELRKCGALVPAHHYGCDEPDTKHIKKQKSGEFSEGDVKKVIMTPTIWARVLEWWKKLNPDAMPTILFGPGVAESIWFAEQFKQAGVKAAHIDGDDVWIDGEFYKSSPEVRQQVIEGSKSGDIKVVCNRFVLREGIDMPWLAHGIFATVFGALQSYLQSGGRLLRAHPSLDHVVIQDHGGHWWRHGSLNADREWKLEYTDNIVTGLREERMRNKTEPEPISCPQCGRCRSSGPTCPFCGLSSSKRSRMVVQKDGSLKEHTGDIFKPRRVKMHEDTVAKWTQMYHRAKHSRNEMTFRQAEALFFLENYYYPPRDLPFMPTNDLDWYRSVKEVPKGRLVWADPPSRQEEETPPLFSEENG